MGRKIGVEVLAKMGHVDEYMRITVLKNGRHWGPYSREELQQHLDAGSFLSTDSAWDGFQFVPLNILLHPKHTPPAYAEKRDDARQSIAHSAAPNETLKQNSPHKSGVFEGIGALVGNVIKAAIPIGLFVAMFFGMAGRGVKRTKPLIRNVPKLDLPTTPRVNQFDELGPQGGFGGNSRPRTGDSGSSFKFPIDPSHAADVANWGAEVYPQFNTPEAKRQQEEFMRSLNTPEAKRQQEEFMRSLNTPEAKRQQEEFMRSLNTPEAKRQQEEFMRQMGLQP